MGGRGSGVLALPANVVATTLVLVMALLAWCTGLGATSAFAASGPGASLGPWHMTGKSMRLSFISDQGLTTVISSGHSKLLYRGDQSIPLRQRLEGWDHVGDPDSWQGYVIDAYERDNSRAKMFLVTTPGRSDVGARAPTGRRREIRQPVCGGIAERTMR